MIRAILPTAFCYPGSGEKGDLPPRPECAPLWPPKILPLLHAVQLTIYIGIYAFDTNLVDHYRNLSEAVADYRVLLPLRIALPFADPRAGRAAPKAKKPRSDFSEKWRTAQPRGTAQIRVT